MEILRSPDKSFETQEVIEVVFIIKHTGVKETPISKFAIGNKITILDTNPPLKTFYLLEAE